MCDIASCKVFAELLALFLIGALYGVYLTLLLRNENVSQVLIQPLYIFGILFLSLPGLVGCGCVSRIPLCLKCFTVGFRKCLTELSELLRQFRFFLVYGGDCLLPLVLDFTETFFKPILQRRYFRIRSIGKQLLTLFCNVFKQFFPFLSLFFQVGILFCVASKVFVCLFSRIIRFFGFLVLVGGVL